MRVRGIEEKISMDKVLKGWLIWLPELRSLRKLVKRIFEEHNITQMGALYKTFDNPCRWIKEDYCTLRYFRKEEIGENWAVKENIVEGEVVYKLNVIEHPWLCLGCLFYQPTKTDYQEE